MKILSKIQKFRKEKQKTMMSLALALTLVVPAVFVYSPNQLTAAGVAVTATPNVMSLTTATDITFTWTASTAVEASGTTFTFTVSPALPSALSNCTVADTQADATSGGTGSFGSFTTTGAVFTTTNATTTTGRSLCLKLPSIASAATYSVSVVSSATNDFGAVLVYVGDDNDVTVTANVNPSLSFNIRDLADTADTNVCALGNVTPSTTAPDADITDDGIGECGYSLAIGTNANSGFQAQITADGALRTGATNLINVTDNASFTAGTEAYGLDTVVAATTGRNTGTGAYDQPLSENNTVGYTFQTDRSPIPTTAQNFISYTNGVRYVAGTDATDVTKVMHGLTVASGTPAGFYSQLVTYTVTATY